MADFDLVAPQTTVSAAFSLEPAYNVLCSLFLLNSERSGLGKWVAQTASKLSEAQLQANERVCGAAISHLRGDDWPSFPAWLDDLAARDPHEMRDVEVEDLVKGVTEFFDGQAVDIPTPDQLLEDRGCYLSLMKRVYRQKGEAFNRSFYETEYELLCDPPARKELIVTHLRAMWDDYVAGEWACNLSALQDSVAAFRSLDFPAMSALETVCKVTQRDQSPPAWEKCLTDVERIVFVPSTHIGPYLVLMDCNEKTARIVMRARIPEGAAITSRVLDRSELLMRLQALADDTRLRILELLAQNNEMTTQDIVADLGLSQSSASRHLSQLGATGYLNTRRREGANRYSLHRDSLDDTFSGLKDYLR